MGAVGNCAAFEVAALQARLGLQGLVKATLLAIRAGMTKANDKREERLKMALRANLGRRKAQAREAADGAEGEQAPSDKGEANQGTGGQA